MDKALFQFPLKRDKLPDDVDMLKDVVLSFSETIEYLQSEIALLRRFSYGSSSERKKKL